MNQEHSSAGTDRSPAIPPVAPAKLGRSFDGTEVSYSISKGAPHWESGSGWNYADMNLQTVSGSEGNFREGGGFSFSTREVAAGAHDRRLADFFGTETVDHMKTMAAFILDLADTHALSWDRISIRFFPE